MKQQKKRKTTAVAYKLAILPAVFIMNTAQAELAIYEQPMLDQPLYQQSEYNEAVAQEVQIGWGNSLEQAKSIMYYEVKEPEIEYISPELIYPEAKEIKDINDLQVIYNDYSSNQLTPQTYNYQSEYNNYSNQQHGQAFSNVGYASTNDYGKLFINTKSPAAIVYDVQTGKPIYEKNTTSARPIASITKLMTAMVLLDAGTNLYNEITLQNFDFRGNGHTKKSSSRLKVGDRLNRSEMLLMTLMKSENPAAKSLARTYPGGYKAFMRAMNQKAKNLGMNNTYFGDPTGLDVRNKASAQDLVKLIKAASQYPIIRRYSTTDYHTFNITNYSRGNRPYRAKNTSRFIRSRDYPISLSKTGYIRESGMCMVMETNINNRPAIVVVLGAGSYASRNSDVNEILTSLQQRW